MGFVHTKPVVAAQFCQVMEPMPAHNCHISSQNVTLCHIGWSSGEPACISAQTQQVDQWHGSGK